MIGRLFSCGNRRLRWTDRTAAAWLPGATAVNVRRRERSYLLAVAQCGGASCELVRPGPHAAVVLLAGEHDVTTLPLLRQVLAPLSLDSGLLAVIDLSRAAFIDAAVLTALGGAERAVTGSGGRFGLLPGSAPAVRRVLELTGWLRRPCVITADKAGSWGFLAARAGR
jgi:anti-anti-sigma factor